MVSFQVSWIRSRDIRVLAIGRLRYTQDSRFTPMHEEGSQVWVLKIQETRLSDSGLYECQVAYHDDVEKKLKMPVRLIVLGEYIRSAPSQLFVYLFTFFGNVNKQLTRVASSQRTSRPFRLSVSLLTRRVYIM